MPQFSGSESLGTFWMDLTGPRMELKQCKPTLEDNKWLKCSGNVLECQFGGFKITRFRLFNVSQFTKKKTKKSYFCSQIMITTVLILLPGPPRWSQPGTVCPWVYLLPLLLPAGGFLSCSRVPPVLKPAAGWFETPKVRPAEGLRPGLLKLKPEVLLLPKPGIARKREDEQRENNYFKLHQHRSWENLYMATGSSSSCGRDALNNITWVRMRAAADRTCAQTASRRLTGWREGKRRPPSAHPTKSWPSTKTCRREWYSEISVGHSRAETTLGRHRKHSLRRAGRRKNEHSEAICGERMKRQTQSFWSCKARQRRPQGGKAEGYRHINYYTNWVRSDHFVCNNELAFFPYM